MFGAVNPHDLRNDRRRADSDRAPTHQSHRIIRDYRADDSQGYKSENRYPPGDFFVFYANEENQGNRDDDGKIGEHDVETRLLQTINSPHQRSAAALQKRQWHETFGRFFDEHPEHLWPDEKQR